MQEYQIAQPPKEQIKPQGDTFESEFLMNAPRQAQFLREALSIAQEKMQSIEAQALPLENIAAKEPGSHDSSSDDLIEMNTMFYKPIVEKHGDVTRVEVTLEPYTFSFRLSEPVENETVVNREKKFARRQVLSLSWTSTESHVPTELLSVIPDGFKLFVLSQLDELDSRNDGCFFVLDEQSVNFQGLRTEADIFILFHEIGHGYNKAVDPEWSYRAESANKTLNEYRNVQIEGIKKGTIVNGESSHFQSNTWAMDTDEHQLQYALATNADSERFASIFSLELIKNFLPEFATSAAIASEDAWKSYEVYGLNCLISVSDAGRELPPEDRQQVWSFYKETLARFDEFELYAAETKKNSFRYKIGMSEYLVDVADQRYTIKKRTIFGTDEFSVAGSRVSAKLGSGLSRQTFDADIFSTESFKSFEKQLKKILEKILHVTEIVSVLAREEFLEEQQKKSALLVKLFGVSSSPDVLMAELHSNLIDDISSWTKNDEFKVNDVERGLLSFQIDVLSKRFNFFDTLKDFNFNPITGIRYKTKWERFIHGCKRYLMKANSQKAEGESIKPLNVMALSDAEVLEQLAVLTPRGNSENVNPNG